MNDKLYKYISMLTIFMVYNQNELQMQRMNKLENVKVTLPTIMTIISQIKINQTEN